MSYHSENRTGRYFKTAEIPLHILVGIPLFLPVMHGISIGIFYGMG